MREIIRALFRLVLRLFYRVEVSGLEHYRAIDGRLMVVANHASLLDGILLGAFLSKDFAFVVNTEMARRWWARPFLSLAHVVTVDFANPVSLKNIIRHLQDDEQVVIFPEGRITLTGSLMKVYQGPAMVADKAATPILPVRIEGAQYTPFSRLRGKVRLRWFPKIRITVLPAVSISVPADLRGHERRDAAGKQLVDIMTAMMYQTGDLQQTLYARMLRSMEVYGRKHVVAEDITRQTMTYDQLVVRSCVLGQLLSGDSEMGDYVGLLLPNSNAVLVTFMALQLYGRVPVMLNFSAGVRANISAVETAQLKTVYTSHAFVEKAGLQELVDALAGHVDICYLEELRGRVGLLRKIEGKLASRFIHVWFRWHGGRRGPDEPAVVLFTSGSEGDPKGVVLSHRNIVANVEQIVSRVEFSPQDVVLNVLPVFHAFGLTAATLLPLFNGMKLFFYPSPLHYRVVPEIAYDIGATVLFGTNTFLYQYALHAHPYDFYKMRYVVAGAERLAERTRSLWIEKFGIRIFEGYGVTEASPVLSVNTVMDYRVGSVGRLFPGIESRLAPVKGIDDGGLLIVKGRNIMLGYLFHDQLGLVHPPVYDGQADWYDTGDIVHVDEDGYLFIRGRAKRFAKLGGEMVSLAQVEHFALQASPDGNHVAVALQDKRKGERIVLLTTDAGLDVKGVKDQVGKSGASMLHVPAEVLYVEEIPLLGTGKADFAAAVQLAAEQVKADA